MKKYLLLSLLTCLLCLAAHAQDIITVSGKVVDSRNRAMSKVNVHAVGSPVATVTNGDGEFVLKLPSDRSDSPIKFSYVGYVSVAVSVSELDAKQGGAVIKLEQEELYIGAINVDLKNATSYIEEVLRLKYNNYPQDKNYQTAFYREAIKKRQSFATLTEAVVEIEKSGIQSISGDRAAIYKGRSFRDNRFTDTLFVKFQGGIVSALLLDVAQEDQIIFTDNPSKEYNFWFDQSTTIDGRKMRVVSFSPKGASPNMMYYKGALYVDSLTMAIARVEFSLDIKGYNDAASTLVKKKPTGTKVDMLEAKYTAEYRFLNDKWHFNYCSTELNFRCQFRRRLFRNNYTIVSEMVVTDHDSEPKKIPYSSSVRSGDFTYESAQSFYDENFWENYNIIEHEHSIDADLRRFLRQLKE